MWYQVFIITNREAQLLKECRSWQIYYRRDYPILISRSWHWCCAVGEVKGSVFGQNGIITIAINAISYEDENNPKRQSWSIFYHPEK